MNTLKLKLTAILLTFAMLFSLMPALPQAAEAATSSKENDLLKVDYYTQLGDQDRSIDVIVQTSDGEQLTSLKISDYNWGVSAADTITLKNTDYYIRDIQKNGSGVFAVTSVSETQANFSWTTMDNGDQIIVTVDSMDCAINDLITGGVTRTYRIYEDQVMKMICDQDKDIVNGNDLPSITTMKPVWKDSFYDTPGAGSNKTFMKADLTHSPNEKYWHLEVTCENGKIVQVQPYQIESIQITYEYNGTEKTITVPASDLVYYGHDVETYDIELNDPSFNIICFYNETDGLTGNIYQLYALRAVETNTALGTENMPPVPTYGDGSKYVFTNWEVNAWDGSGTTFDANDIVTEDINVYAKKLSTEGEGGIEIHVMNDNNALIERAVEIYNAENGANLSVDQIDMDSIKIRVNGNQGTSTNEYYWENKWKDEYDWYWVANYNLSSLPGTTHNDRVPFAQIDNITIYFQANDGTVAGASTIEVGDTQEGIDYGELEKMQLGDERIIELRLKGPAVPPTEEELEGDSDNPGILGEDAVKVQCTTNEEEHEAITTGLLPDSYSVSEKATWKKINGEAAYYVDVTVEDDKYVENYNNSHKGHTLDGADSQTITLKWNGSAWTPVTKTPVTFNVKCTSEEPTTPEKPGEDTVKELLENAVTVECNNESATHDNRDGKTYGLIEDGYTLAEKVTGDADDGYTYTVTIQPDAYVSQYSTDTEVDHDLDPADQENKTITLEWTGTEWQVAEDSTPVTITVHCDSEEPTPTTPEKPDADDLNDLFDVELDCGSNVGHQNKIYKNLLSDSYTLDDQVTTNTDGTYTIGVTVKSAEYIKDYDKQDLNPAGKHEIKDGEESSKTVTLMYNEDEEAWTADESDKLITFLIVCSGTGNYDINGITKDLVAGETDKNTAIANGVKSFDGLTIPEENEKVIIPAGESVTLLYSITVTGNANKEVEFVVKDKDTTLVKSNADVTQKDDGTYTGTIPAGGNVTFYVSKEFTGANINKDGELVNTASVDGADDETTVDPDDKVDETVPAEDGPALPDQDAMNALLDVVLDCASNVGHADGTYKDLLENSYDFGDVTHNDEGAYSVGVTIDSDKYIADYSNNVVKVAHEIQDETQATKTVTLTYDKDHETWTTTGSPVEFLIVCEGVDWDISNIEKDLVTEATLDDAKANGVSDDALKNIIVPEDMDDTVIIPEDGSVTLLYAITVSGKAGIAFSVEDPGTTLVKSSANVSVDENADVATYTGSIPENGIVTFYVSKNFTVDNITENGQLVNSATVAGDDGTTVNPGTEDDPANKDDEAIAGEEEDNRPTPPPYIPGGDDDDNLGDNDGPSGLNTEDHFSYVVGYEDGMVKPQRSITRAEVATIFYRLLEDDVRDDYDTTRNNFSDVTSDSWYNQTVSTLASMGILKGYEDGTFRPNASITRAEFAAIATRFFEETGATYEPGTFTDVTGDEWFAGAIMDAVNLGLIGGYEDGTVRPNNNITRAEACAIVNRTLGRVPDADHLLPADEMTTWPDNPSSAWFYADMQEATNGHEYEWITEDGNKIEEWTDILDKDWNDR